MNRELLQASIALCLAFILTGCVGVEVYSSHPEVQRVSNDYFTAEIRPQLKEGQSFFATFRFVITNKTDKELKIDWENTFYLLNGRRNGPFLWEGVNWDELKKMKSRPLVPVAAGDTIWTVIFPARLVGRGTARSHGGVQYTRGALPAGENGILLVVRQDGKVVREKMAVTIEAN